jgi:hypothetical protein
MALQDFTQVSEEAVGGVSILRRTYWTAMLKLAEA